MWKAVEIAVLVLLILCTALLLVIRGTRFIVAFSLRMLFVTAVGVGVVCYMLGEIGVL
jgi:hypothetical protein